MIHLIILGQTPSKKSSQRIVKLYRGLRLLPNEKYSKWESGAIYQLLAQKNDLNLKTIEKEVHVKALIYRNTKRKIDLSNLIQSIHDVLERAKIIKNDFLIYSVDGSRRYLGEPIGEERAEIYIEERGEE